MLHGGHCVHIRDDALINDGPCILMQRHEFLKSPLVVFRRIERGYINAVKFQQTRQKRPASPRPSCLFPCNERIHHFAQDDFALSDHEKIEEIRHGFHIVNTRPAADHEGHVLPALCRMKRDARQIQHVQHIGINHLVLQGKSQKIKGLHRLTGLQSKKRDATLPHQHFHIRPWRIDTLHRRILAPIQDSIENRKSQIRHADLIDIRQGKRNRAVHRAMLLMHRAPFSARIARRLQHGLQHVMLQLYHSKYSPELLG